MQRQTFTVPCTSKQLLANNIYELRFKRPVDFAFTAGQYVMWSVPLVADPTSFQNRAYSIASAPSAEELVFAIKILKGGRASDWIQQSVTVGTEVQMYGPFGGFTAAPDAHSLVFLATSTGIAPYISIIEQNLYTKKTTPIHLLFSVQNTSELFYEKYLQQLSAAYPQFTYQITITQSSAEWQGVTGRVQKLLPQALVLNPRAHVYACGNPAMTKEVKQLLLEGYGLPKERVKIEGYI